MKQIIPAILETDFKNFSQQLKNLSRLSNLIQIDIVDGIFLPKKTFNDVEKINELNPSCQFELHFMVKNPLQEMEKWSLLKNICRVIFHIEAKSDIEKCITYARKHKWQVGIALNPETSIIAGLPYFKKVDTVMFLTVQPGQQGNKFLPEIKEKIKEFTALPEHPFCEADGGINENNLPELLHIGVDIFSIGSAITRAKNPKKIYEELKSLIA